MTDPCVISTCGHSFNKNAIYEWVGSRKNCPICKAPARRSDLLPNYALKSIIDKKLERAQKMVAEMRRIESGY